MKQLNKMKPLIGVVLVEDHQMFRIAIKSYLEKAVGIRIIGEADNGEDAVVLVKRLRPEVCIMDITIRGLNGVEATKQISRACPNTRVLALSASTKRDYINSMIQAGAYGYVVKHGTLEQLCEAVRSVAAGFRYFSPEIFSDERNGDHEGIKEQKAKLSLREVQIVQLVVDGKTSKEIGSTLGLSPRTIDTHRTRILYKTDTHSTAELVKYAIREGIIQSS